MVWTTRTIGLSLAGVAACRGLAYVAFREDPVPVDLVDGGARAAQRHDRRRRADAHPQPLRGGKPHRGHRAAAPVAVGDSVVADETVVAMVEPVSPALLDARTRAQAEASRGRGPRRARRGPLRPAPRGGGEAFARLQFDRTQTLMTRGVATVTQMETVAQGLAVAEAAVAAAQSRVAMSEGSLERAEATLARPEGAPSSAADCCVILRAPSDGVVLSIATISEHPVQAGAPLLSVGDPTDLEIVADLLSSDAVRIGPGTRAIVERWGGPDPLEATLTRIEPAAETRVSALGIEEQRVDAIFAIETPPEDRPGLGHGFAVFLRIVEWESDDALQVPLGALFRRDGTGRSSSWRTAWRASASSRSASAARGRRRCWRVWRRATRIVTHPSDAVADGVMIVDRTTL
jgi:HlyD family secretion protein